MTALGPHRPSSMSEAVLQDRVLAVAALYGWTLRYHTWSSVRSEPGFPDLCLIRPPRVVFVELKRADGRLTRPQQAWHRALMECPGVEMHIWRPDDLDSGLVAAVLCKRPVLR